MLFRSPPRRKRPSRNVVFPELFRPTIRLIRRSPSTSSDPIPRKFLIDILEYIVDRLSVWDVGQQGYHNPSPFFLASTPSTHRLSSVPGGYRAESDWASFQNRASLPIPDTDREIRARFDRQASATKQRPLPWSLPILMRKTVFFFVSFRRRAMQAWVLFLVSIERGTPMPDLSLPSLAV